MNLDQANADLKASRSGVIIQEIGNRLYLRGTFPPKPDSGKPKPHQQDISLGIYAHPAGFKRAKAIPIPYLLPLPALG